MDWGGGSGGEGDGVVEEAERRGGGTRTGGEDRGDERGVRRREREFVFRRGGRVGLAGEGVDGGCWSAECVGGSWGGDGGGAGRLKNGIPKTELM